MRKRQRGNAFIEFALAAGILLPVMAGTFQFGFTFYTYNLLQAAVSNGGRYAAYRTYRCLAGETDIIQVPPRGAEHDGLRHARSGHRRGPRGERP